MRQVFFNGKLWGRAVQSFAVENGRFQEFGCPETDGGIDLQGRTVFPGFVDCHCHILPTGLDLMKLHLGECSSHDEVLDAVREWLPKVQPGDWLLAVHYDQNRFDGGQHLHRQQLDAISADIPILLRHVNGHASVANSAALVAANIDSSTRDPKGGTFVRDAQGELTGVLLETAHERVSAAAPTPTESQMVEAILLAGSAMAELGVTTASDMMTGRWDLLTELRAYAEAARRGCKVRLRVCLQWSPVLGKRGVDPGQLQEHLADLESTGGKSLGLKIFADGAIGSATAAIYGEYSGGGNGQLIYAEDRLKEMVTKAEEAGYRVVVHSIGDRSTDLVMDAFEAGGNGAAHRLEHIMILSDAQIERLARIGCQTTMQPEFLRRFGHAYLAQLGPERASMLKRARSVIDAGIPLAFSSDRPIVLGDPWVGIQMAVNRPEGYAPAENIALDEAVAAYTVAGAMANYDDHYGELKEGASADFVVRDEHGVRGVYFEGRLTHSG